MNNLATACSVLFFALILLCLVGVIYYVAKFYGENESDELYKKEIIVTEKDRRNIFRNLSWAFCIGGILSFLSEYIPYHLNDISSLKSGFLKGGFLLVIGCSIRILQRIKKDSLKEALTIIILVLSIPIVQVQFLEEANLTVWVFPIVIIMSSLIFSKRILLVSATIMAIITQRLIWTLKADTTVLINEYDYIARIGMFIISFLIGFYINKLYVAKIKENRKQIAFQKINSEVSIDFITINEQNFNEKINKFLETIGKFFSVDRTYLFLLNHQDHTMTYSHEWCKEGIKPEVGSIEKIPFDVFTWWLGQLENNKLVYIEDVNKMPVEAREEQGQLIRQQVKSLISVPVGTDNHIQGFIGIDSVVVFKKWSEEKVKQLNILANLISHGLAKIQAEQMIEFMAYYDRLTNIPNRFLFKDRVHQAIKLAKRNKTFISIVFIDLDNFKLVNDTVGHDGGDYLLKQVAQNLQGLMRKTDTVARFGGDEFMIVLGDLNHQEDILKVVHKIMNLFSKPFNIKKQDFLVTASAGISVYPADGTDSEALINSADMAMYEAKAKGKNQYAFYSQEIGGKKSL